MDSHINVVIPKTCEKYTSKRVLTTGWIEGEKLSQSTESDVGEFVNVGFLCYWKQLLDTGFFHADPHPGNLIRIPEGKLAILDFGYSAQQWKYTPVHMHTWHNWSHKMELYFLISCRASRGII
ncbi:hypothetical protein L6164_016586 [Bauhinia variegata]|uniref:Uncharacterized protein n=1 Tax=Bauhinia variegata TaxID=167791 RepID=A0ACB9NPE8_BAUVA|nr:hypothetical protein L6164_016586 [Bauhinia variegata]